MMLTGWLLGARWSHLVSVLSVERCRRRDSPPLFCQVTRDADGPEQRAARRQSVLGVIPCEARLRRCRWVTVREFMPTSQARLYPALASLFRAKPEQTLAALI
jgi:hypothetical protein